MRWEKVAFICVFNIEQDLLIIIWFLGLRESRIKSGHYNKLSSIVINKFHPKSSTTAHSKSVSVIINHSHTPSIIVHHYQSTWVFLSSKEKQSEQQLSFLILYTLLNIFLMSNYYHNLKFIQKVVSKSISDLSPIKLWKTLNAWQTPEV